MFAGGHDNRAVFGDMALATEDDLLIQSFGWQVPIHFAQVGEAVVFQAIIGAQGAGLS